MANVLIVDDDRDVGETIVNVVSHMGYNPVWASSFWDAKTRILQMPFNLAFVDVRLPDGDGLEILSLFRKQNPSGETIVMTGFGDPKGAEVAIKRGAFDYLQKPITLDELKHVLSSALAYAEEQKRRDSVPPPPFDRRGIVGTSPELQACIDSVADASGTTINVLITGETGTGKERFAEAVHYNSQRRDQPFIVVDCASLPKTLVESELFGYEKGAFTGADRSKEGLVKQADGGSLFLDEIGELPLGIQKKFLRVLQERSFRPVGSKRLQTSDFRLIAATNRSLVEMVARGEFREDLLFRLKAMAIELPPLRQRREDLKSLADHFLKDICDRYRMEKKAVSDDFYEVLAAYNWPGNVRELYQVIESVVVNANGHTKIFPQDLPSDLRVNVLREAVGNHGSAAFESDIWKDIKLPESLPPIKELRERAMDELSREYTKELLRRTGGNMEKARRIAGLSRSRIYAFVKKYSPSNLFYLRSSEDMLD